MNIRLASIVDASRWDAFVENHCSASPYHLWAWKEAVEAAYGHKGYYLIAEEQGAIMGILPLIHMRLPLLSNQLVSLPFCDLGGCVADSPDAQDLLVSEAIRHGRELNVKKIDIRTSSALALSAPPYAGERVSVSRDKVRMLLDLPQGAETLWSDFKSKLRSQINRSAKNGLLFAWGEEHCEEQFYTVFSANMRDLGSPVHARSWIQAVLRYYGDAARMGLIHKDGAPVACGIILMAGRQVSIPWASTLREYNNLSPNMLLYWNFLKYAADTGHDRFDFGRSTPGEGTYKFKAQWGAEPHTLYWHTLHLNGQSVGNENTGGIANGNRERLASLWARLPLWAANSLGPRVRRHISL